MIKVVVQKPKPRATRGKPRKPATVAEKIIYDQSGRRMTLRTLDIDSKTFGEDFLYVFKKNVERARRENKKIIGVRDVAPKK